MSTTIISTTLSRALVAACALALAAPAALADEGAACAGLLRLKECKATEAHAYPLPATFMASTRKAWGAFKVTNITTNETFTMNIYPHYPVAAGAEPTPIANIENDGANYIVPIDLTGRGVSDIMVSREGWGGWYVYTNGQCLPKAFDGFVAGFLPKGSETVTAATLNMDLSDLQVDNNLLGVVGDFLGNGTEQLAYFRPEWDAIQVVGAHGKARFPADLRGIKGDKAGDRQHWLFAFKSDKPGGRTKFAYHRRGVPKMLVFTSDGKGFHRSEVDTKEQWNLLNQFTPNPL